MLSFMPSFTVTSHERQGGLNLRHLHCLINRCFGHTPNKLQSPALLALYEGNPPMDSPTVGPITQKYFYVTTFPLTSPPLKKQQQQQQVQTKTKTTKQKQTAAKKQTNEKANKTTTTTIIIYKLTFNKARLTFLTTAKPSLSSTMQFTCEARWWRIMCLVYVRKWQTVWWMKYASIMDIFIAMHTARSPFLFWLHPLDSLAHWDRNITAAILLTTFSSAFS